MGKYVLSVIFLDGKTTTTTFEGYYAESCADRQFNALAEHNSSILFAAVCDGPEFGASPRRIYRHPEFTK